MNGTLHDLATAIGLMNIRSRRELRRQLVDLYEDAYMAGWHDADLMVVDEPLCRPEPRKHLAQVVDRYMLHLTVPAVQEGKQK